MSSMSEEVILSCLMQEFERLPDVVPRTIFGHKGFAYGTSVFAFLDGDRLVIKTHSLKDVDTLPRGFEFFPPIASGRSWVGFELSDTLREVNEHWHLIEESYAFAKLRDAEKSTKPAKKKPIRKK